MKFFSKIGFIYFILLILLLLMFKSYDLMLRKHEKNRQELFKTNDRIQNLYDNKGINEQALSILSESLSGKKVDDTSYIGNEHSLNIKSFYIPYVINANYDGSLAYNANSILKSKKPSYIEKINNKIFIFFWSGKIIYLDENIEIFDYENTDNLNFVELPSNLNGFKAGEHLDEVVMQTNYWNGIKDAIYIKNKIYLSYVKEVEDNCWNTSVLVADLNFEYLNFEDFFTYSDCLKNENEFQGVQSGGKLLRLSETEMLLSIGDYRYRTLAQNKESIFGKIIKINMESGEYQIVSMGHRNPQGMTLINDNLLLATEHGPKRGDEINKISLDIPFEEQNYGWPIASYGEHYDGKFRPEAPLKKSHRDNGFLEPIHFFDKNYHGVSSIQNIEENNNFFVASLKGGNLYIFSAENNNYNDIQIKETFFLNNRIRDILKINKNLYLLTLEGTLPSLSFLKFL